MTKEELLTSGGWDFTVSKQKMFYHNEDWTQGEQEYNDTSFFCTVNDKTGEVHLISLGTDADRDENNELVEAGKFYKNLNFTAAAKRGEREKPSEILLQNQLNPRDVRQGLW